MADFPSVVSASYPKTAGQRIPNPSLPLTEGWKTSALSIEFDAGNSQRRVKAPPKRTFQLTYNVLTADQYKTIRDFYLVNLTVYAFTWIHPVEGTSLSMRFTNDTFNGENFAFGPKGALYKLQLTIEQDL